MRSSMAKLGGGGGEPGTVVSWTTYTELALAGKAVPRCAEERSPTQAREAKQKGTTSQHRRSVLTIGPLKPSLFVTKPGPQKRNL